MYEGLTVGVTLFLVVLGVLWFLLPFAIFGIKDRLDNLVREQRRSNELLEQMTRSAQPAVGPPVQAAGFSERDLVGYQAPRP